MPATVTKSQLLESIKEVLIPILDRQAAEGTTLDALHEDTKFVGVCRSLADDLEAMFRYTYDRETWSHTDDLMANNPFPPGLLSTEPVASKEVSSYLFELAEKYFSQGHIKTRELDWFYLDFIVAVCFRALLKSYGEKDLSTAYPAICKAIDEFDGSNIRALIKYVLIAAAKNFITFGLAAFLFVVASDSHNALAGLVGGALIAWKLYGWLHQIRTLHKLKILSFEKLSQFNSTYKLFSDGFVRWDLLEHDIKRLRDLSIDFPLVLDTAITATSGGYRSGTTKLK